MSTPWDLEEHMLPGMGGGELPAPSAPMPVLPDPPEAYPSYDQQSYVPAGSGLNDDQRTLDAEYHAARAEQARHDLAKLDKAAKFRRALAMITETFGVITGRPDLASMAREQIVQEDRSRAEQANAKILAHVGLASLERERQRRDMSMDRLETRRRYQATKIAQGMMSQPGFFGPADILPKLIDNIDARLAGFGPVHPDIEGTYGVSQDKAAERKVDVAVNTAKGVVPIQTAGQIDVATAKAELEKEDKKLGAAIAKRLIAYRKTFPDKSGTDIVAFDVKHIVGDKQRSNARKLKELRLLYGSMKKRPDQVPQDLLTEIEKYEALVRDDIARQVEAQARGN